MWKSTYSLVEHWVTYHNGFQASGDGNGVKAGGPVTGHALVRNVLSFGNKDAGFTYNDSNGVTFQNKTAFRNDGYGFVISNGTAQNNLAFGNSSGNFGTFGTGNTLQNNSWQLASPTPGSRAPMLVTLTSCRWRQPVRRFTPASTSAFRSAGRPPISVRWSTARPSRMRSMACR